MEAYAISGHRQISRFEQKTGNLEVTAESVGSCGSLNPILGAVLRPQSRLKMKQEGKYKEGVGPAPCSYEATARHCGNVRPCRLRGTDHKLVRQTWASLESPGQIPQRYK